MIYLNQIRTTISYDILKDTKIYGSILEVELNSDASINTNEYLNWNNKYCGNVVM